MPVAVADVREWLGDVDSVIDVDVLTRVCAAVDEWAARHYDLTTVAPTEEHEQALIMQAGRLYRRRHSPDGISGADDLAPIRVHTFDVDVARLLSGRLRTAGLFGPSENTAEEA